MEEVGNNNKSRQLFETFIGSPEILHIKTDKTGAFSFNIPAGSYIICTAYKFPWNQTWDYYINKHINVENNTQLKLKIILNPDWGGLKIEDS